MKKFYDLGISSALSSGDAEPEEMINIAIDLGFSGVALADFNDLTPKVIKKIRKSYEDDLEIYTRATIEPKTTAELKRLVKKLRNQVDILAVKSGINEKNIYVNAILDKRVDVISLVDMPDFNLDYAHFKMAKKNGTMIELVTRNLIIQGGVRRSKLMRQMIKCCGQLSRAKAPFLISSGAQSKWELRGPRDLIALVSLIGIPEQMGLEGISIHPEKLIEKIQMIRDPSVIMAGVRIVTDEEGDNYGQ
jgi:ribonuclease P/MRP protein subunit RPP1